MERRLEEEEAKRLAKEKKLKAKVKALEADNKHMKAKYEQELTEYKKRIQVETEQREQVASRRAEDEKKWQDSERGLCEHFEKKLLAEQEKTAACQKQIAQLEEKLREGKMIVIVILL